MKIELNARWKTSALCATVLASGALAAFAANSGVRLTMNGKIASYDVRTISGKTYVATSDK